jgi:hypothetical protein
MADKYASAVPKNLGVGEKWILSRAVEAISSLGVHSPWIYIFDGLHGILTFLHSKITELINWLQEKEYKIHFCATPSVGDFVSKS